MTKQQKNKKNLNFLNFSVSNQVEKFAKKKAFFKV